MTTAMRIRRRDAITGRWPVGETHPDRRARVPGRRRHARKSGGLSNRTTGNTRRGQTAGQARMNRGRKRVITSARHGGAYGEAAAL
jgi:hypothetical protein